MRSFIPFYDFVHALYTDEVPLPTDSDFYSDLLTVLEKEDLKSQIYQLLCDQGKLWNTPAYFQNSLRERRDRALVQNMYIKHETERILSSFDNVGMVAIILKGTRFAKRYFGHYEARPTSDIDLLIPKGLAEKAWLVLCELGYSGPHCSVPNHFHEEFIRETKDPCCPLVVELHYDLVKPQTANLNLAAFWENAHLIPKYKYIYELSEQYTFYVACIHAANHNLDFMKHQLDIVHLLCREGDSIDLVNMLSVAESDNTVCLVRIVLSTVYERFPFLNMIHSLPPKLYATGTRDHIKSNLYLRLALIDGWKRRMRFLAIWFFPTKAVAIHWAGLEKEKEPTLIRTYTTLYALRLVHLYMKLARSLERRRAVENVNNH